MDESTRQMYINIIQLRIKRMSNGTLNLSGLGLPEIPIPLPETLIELNCSNNQLTALPPLPPTLEVLIVRNNHLTSLNGLHENIIHIEADYNRLTSLPELPSQLNHLGCDYNNLTSLPPLPQSLRWLSCMVNPISTLPPLPPKLNLLNCAYNELESLPPLPTKLTWMQCGGNPLREPFQSFQKQFLSQTTDPKVFVSHVNKYYEQQERIKESLVMRKYDPKRIQANLERNAVNLSNGLNENVWNKYYSRRGEVWTEGTGTQYGPWFEGKRIGGSERSGNERSGKERSGKKTRKIKNKQKYSRKRY